MRKRRSLRGECVRRRVISRLKRFLSPLRVLALVAGLVVVSSTSSLPAQESDPARQGVSPQASADAALIAISEAAEMRISERGLAAAGSPVAPFEHGCSGECPTVGPLDLAGAEGLTIENVIISNPSGRCIDLTGARNITIRNVSILECGTTQSIDEGYSTGLIHISEADSITIENSLIAEISNERFGESRNNAIEIESSTNVSIRSNVIVEVHSDIEQRSGDRGNRAIFVEGTSSNITIDSNRFSNAGRNAVQFSRVRDATGIVITNNVIEGRGRWDSDYEDMINLFSTSGTAGDPIRIAGNTLRNGGPSTSGTGIIVGDGNTASGATQHVVVEDNVLIDPGHVGINLAGGNSISVLGNVILGTGPVPHDTTVGMSINHFGYSVECRDHVVAENLVWMDNQHLDSGTNHLWNPGTCSNNVQLTGNLFGN